MKITISREKILAAKQSFKNNHPFDHYVIDNLFSPELADILASQFLEYDSPKWFFYQNAIEDKKTINDWNIFPKETYAVFQYLNSPEFISALSEVVGCELFPDNGLHGGGWHIHGKGGNLNPHLDYSIHPKLGLQRRVNIIIYMSKEIQEQHGGHLGLWEGTPEEPKKLVHEVAPKFNRAVIFDTTQNSWHGMSRMLALPDNVYRKSLAVYYLCEPSANADPRNRALFAPREEQKGDDAILELISKRANVATSSEVYRTKK